MGSSMWTDCAPSVSSPRTSTTSGPTGRRPSIVQPLRAPGTSAMRNDRPILSSSSDQDTSSDPPRRAVPCQSAPASTNRKAPTPQARYNLRGHRDAPASGKN
ncbi:hypothetical protein MTO96_046789 [Rhipicephalus appendiculatus]